jgi:hypothetical protein
VVSSYSSILDVIAQVHDGHDEASGNGVDMNAPSTDFALPARLTAANIGIDHGMRQEEIFRRLHEMEQRVANLRAPRENSIRNRPSSTFGGTLTPSSDEDRPVMGASSPNSESHLIHGSSPPSYRAIDPPVPPPNPFIGPSSIRTDPPIEPPLQTNSLIETSSFEFPVNPIIESSSFETEGQSNSIADDELAVWAAINRRYIDIELEGKLHDASYHPDANPDDITAERWEQQYGVRDFELTRLREVYWRSVDFHSLPHFSANITHIKENRRVGSRWRR